MDHTTEADDTVRVRDGAAVWRELEGDIIVLSFESSTYLRLNASASALWPSLVAGSTRDELIEVLSGSFDIAQSRAASDVDQFLEACRTHGLLV